VHCGRGALLSSCNGVSGPCEDLPGNSVLSWAVQQLLTAASELISRLAADLCQGFVRLALCCCRAELDFAPRYCPDAVNDHFVAPGIPTKINVYYATWTRLGLRRTRRQLTLPARTMVRRRKILPVVRNTAVAKFQCCAWITQGPTIALIRSLTNEQQAKGDLA